MAQPGWFGKLPALGDFVQRNLSPGFVESWDGWLSENMQHSQDYLGKDWADLYWSMPLWRFVVTASMGLDSTYIGVMAPSVDRVGRTYPLTIALPLGIDAINAEFVESCEVWFDACERVLVETINSDSVGPDALDELIRARLPSISLLVGSAEPLSVGTNPPELLFEIAPAASGEDALSGVWDADCQALISRHRDSSIWWTAGHAELQPLLLACGGWPTATVFRRLLGTPKDHPGPSEFAATGAYKLEDLLGAAATPAAAADSAPALAPGLAGDSETRPSADPLAALAALDAGPPAGAATAAVQGAGPAVDPLDELVGAPPNPATDITLQVPVDDGEDPNSEWDLITQVGVRAGAGGSGCRSFGLSDVGRVRESNQDSILVDPDRGLWAVADGMGGHSGGELASGMIVRELGNLSLGDDPLGNVERIEQLILDIDRKLVVTAEKRNVDIIGSTVIVILATPGHWLVGWVGDSRCYGMSRHGEFGLISRDHGQVEVGLEAGLEWEEIQVHPAYRANGLARAVGAGPDQGELHMDWKVVSRRRLGRLLICSDGLYGAVPVQNISTAMANVSASPEAVVRAMVGEALDNNCNDNVSVVVVDG